MSLRQHTCDALSQSETAFVNADAESQETSEYIEINKKIEKNEQIMKKNQRLMRENHKKIKENYLLIEKNEKMISKNDEIYDDNERRIKENEQLIKYFNFNSRTE